MKRWTIGTYGLAGGSLAFAFGLSHVGRTHYSLKSNSITGDQWPAYIFMLAGATCVIYSLWLIITPRRHEPYY